MVSTGKSMSTLLKKRMTCHLRADFYTEQWISREFSGSADGGRITPTDQIPGCLQEAPPKHPFFSSEKKFISQLLLLFALTLNG